MTDGPLRIGVIGAGAIGGIHAANVAARVPGARLVAIADTDGERAHAAGKRLDVGRVCEDDDGLLADPEVDAVAICSPRETHVPLIVAAAAAGKHIFCEKPLAGALADAETALAAAAAAGVVLQIGFQRCFDAGFRHALDAVESGAIGTPVIVHTVSRDPVARGLAPYRSPEDLILETTIHDLDMARRLAGSEITSVYAAGLPAAEPGRLAGAVLTLRFESGALGTIDNHVASAYGYDQRAEVFGSTGTISVDNETPHRASVMRETGTMGAPPLYFFAERYEAAYIAEMAAFARSVLDGTPPAVTGADGLAATAAALAALESLRTGAAVSVSQ